MNDKDKKAYAIYENTILDKEGYLYIAREAWEAACEYKQKEIDYVGPEYDMSIHSNPSAVAWAKLFIKTIRDHSPEIDEGLMIGWFANAMMAMHDHVNRERDEELTKLKAANKVMKECVEFYADYKNDNPDNDWNNDYARQVLKELEEE